MKTFTKLGATFFALIGFLHLARLWYGWEAAINGVAVPLWASAAAVLAAAAMSWGLWRESK